MPATNIDIRHGDALDLLLEENGKFALIATDPPYTMGGTGDEHRVTATVAVVLRECAQRVMPGGHLIVMCASSWRSISYMVESVRNVIDPVRVGTWCKPQSKTKVKTAGWSWASASVIVFRKGSAITNARCATLDHVLCEPTQKQRRAQLPADVARWMVEPYVVEGERMLDPFAGSGAIVQAATELGMRAHGYEKNPLPEHRSDV
jgi:hypothetical protein